MEGLRADSEAARFIACALGRERFTLVDVGCSGGVDTIWNVFGQALEVYGFDASVAAIDQLNREKTSDRQHFFAGKVGLPADHPFHRIETRTPPSTRNPWDRLAVARTQQIRDRAQTPVGGPPSAMEAGAPAAPSDETLLEHNLWRRTELSDETVHLPDVFARENVSDIDFIKIDIDGPDFEVLTSLAEVLEDAHVLGVGLEVNFVGTDDANQHVFHNTDRFMRAHGFELFELTVRKYASAALPFVYADVYPFAHRAVNGRPFQGDALYVRDLGFAAEAARAEALPAAKILKLAALFALAGHGDQAAEVLLQFRARIEGLLDVDRALDLLTFELHDAAAGAFTDQDRARTYAQYMAVFEADAPQAYGGDSRAHAWIETLAKRAERAEEKSRQAEQQAREAEQREQAARAAGGEIAERLDAMLNSTSWRLTAWLRALRGRAS